MPIEASGQTLDANDDGVVERGEWQNPPEAAFNLLDENDDSVVEPSEYATRSGATGLEPDLVGSQGGFASLDRNRDNLLSQEEFVVGANDAFTGMDFNADNTLQMEEIGALGTPTGG